MYLPCTVPASIPGFATETTVTWVLQQTTHACQLTLLQVMVGWSGMARMRMAHICSRMLCREMRPSYNMVTQNMGYDGSRHTKVVGSDLPVMTPFVQGSSHAFVECVVSYIM